MFHISAQNIDCGYSLEQPRQGGSTVYTKSMFWAEIRDKKNNLYPYKPQFYYIKVVFKGLKLYRHGFVMLKDFAAEKNECFSSKYSAHAMFVLGKQ